MKTHAELIDFMNQQDYKTPDVTIENFKKFTGYDEIEKSPCNQQFYVNTKLYALELVYDGPNDRVISEWLYTKKYSFVRKYRKLSYKWSYYISGSKIENIAEYFEDGASLQMLAFELSMGRKFT